MKANNIKGLVFILLVCFIDLLSACDKSSSSPIEGKWNVVSDDEKLTGGPLIGDETYAGKNGDYFDFRTNNTLYVKEDEHYDTAQYNLISNDKIILIGKNFSMFDTTQSSVITISGNKATIVVYPAGVITPAGAIKRTIILKR